MSIVSFCIPLDNNDDKSHHLQGWSWYSKQWALREVCLRLQMHLPWQGHLTQTPGPALFLLHLLSMQTNALSIPKYAQRTFMPLGLCTCCFSYLTFSPPPLDYQQIQIQLKKHFLEASRLRLPLSRINALFSALCSYTESSLGLYPPWIYMAGLCTSH